MSRGPLSGAWAVLAAVSLGVIGSVAGIVAALGLVASWWLLPVVATVALGHVAVGSVAPEASWLAVLAVEAGLLGLLAVAWPRAGSWPRWIGELAVAIGAVGAVGLGATAVTGHLAGGAVAVVGAVGIAGYGLDRLARFRLGVLADE